MTGWKIDIQKDEADITFEERIALATAKLAAVEDIGQELAASLVASGFLSLEGILAADLVDLVDVEGFDAEIADQVRAAAESAFEEQNGNASEE